MYLSATNNKLDYRQMKGYGESNHETLAPFHNMIPPIIITNKQNYNHSFIHTYQINQPMTVSIQSRPFYIELFVPE